MPRIVNEHSASEPKQEIDSLSNGSLGSRHVFLECEGD